MNTVYMYYWMPAYIYTPYNINSQSYILHICIHTHTHTHTHTYQSQQVPVTRAVANESGVCTYVNGPNADGVPIQQGFHAHVVERKWGNPEGIVVQAPGEETGAETYVETGWQMQGWSPCRKWVRKEGRESCLCVYRRKCPVVCRYT
jgi:hypothetical protein